MFTKMLAFGAVLFNVACGAGTSQERLSRYQGTPLDAGSPLLCRSNKSASGGFWRDLRQVDEGARFGPQPETTWRVTIEDDIAEVVRFSGATKTLEEPQYFTVGMTSGGLLLTYNRSAFESSQIVTIDPRTSSFVYSTQHVGQFHNRASIFYGTCYAYP